MHYTHTDFYSTLLIMFLIYKTVKCMFTRSVPQIAVLRTSRTPYKQINIGKLLLQTFICVVLNCYSVDRCIDQSIPKYIQQDFRSFTFGTKIMLVFLSKECVCMFITQRGWNFGMQQDSSYRFKIKDCFRTLNII